MKLFYSILFLQLSISNSFSQATINVIKSGELKFPIIELTNKRASQKINEYLQTNMLEQTTLKIPVRNYLMKENGLTRHLGLMN